MKKVTYNKKKIEYDENQPCIVCGEPVLAASSGGIVICNSCGMGKCRYCGISIFVLKEQLDGGHSKQNILRHMKWHKKHTPEVVKSINKYLKDLEEK